LIANHSPKPKAGQDFNQTNNYSKSIRLIKVIISLCLFRLTFPQVAHAYLDLGTGSYLTQLVIASLLGGLVAIKAYWQKLCQFVTGFFTQRPGNEKEKI
jgi:hypothetical protein